MFFFVDVGFVVRKEGVLKSRLDQNEEWLMGRMPTIGVFQQTLTPSMLLLCMGVKVRDGYIWGHEYVSFF